MEKHTKKILGGCGLAAVATMTGIAISLPSPDAEATSSASVTYSVTVRQAASVQIISPTDGQVFTSTPVEAIVDYTEGDAISYTLSYVKDGVTETASFGPFALTELNGQYTITFDDFSQYAGFGDYTLNVKIDSTAAAEDSVSFKYKALYVEQIGTDENGNPIVHVDENPDSPIDHITADITDPDGNPIAGPIPVTPDENGNTPIDLDDLGLPEGDYDITFNAYDIDGNLIDTYTIRVHYSPNAPAVPDTGALTIGDLTISQTDFLLTALVVFVLTAGAAMFVLRKKHQR